jgi:tRNA A37 methylthiotransferase MiaB
MSKIVSLLSFGCQLNQWEIVTFCEQLEDIGMQVSRQLTNDVDLLIINTYAITDQSMSKCMQNIRSVLLKFPEVSVIITVCYSSIDGDILAKMNGIDMIVVNSQKNTIEYHALEIIMKLKN